MNTTADLVAGWTDPRFSGVADELARQADADPAYSAQVSVFVRGVHVVDLWTGSNLREDSLICVFSVSKGLSAICIGILVERGLLDLDTPVASYWPEFAEHGKESITVTQLLTHQAGLHDVDGGFTWAELRDDALAAPKVARQRPYWRPGAAWGYHALSLGVLMNELCRRVSGRSLQEFYEDEVRERLGIELWLGLPEELEPRVSRVHIPDFDVAANPSPQLGDLNARYFVDPGFEVLANSRDAHAAGLPAAGAVGSARGIARLYAAVGDDLGGGRLWSDETIARFGQVQVDGPDLLSGMHGRFGVVFQKPHPARPFASHQAIGHDGAAGALGYLDPHDGVAFGFVTDTPAPPGGDLRADALASAVRAALSPRT